MTSLAHNGVSLSDAQSPYSLSTTPCASRDCLVLCSNISFTKIDGDYL